MSGFGLPVMGLHTASTLCFEARHTWFDLCVRALLGPQIAFLFHPGASIGSMWSWTVGVRGIGAIQYAVKRCGAIHSTASWKLNMADNCCQSWGYTRCILVLWAEQTEFGGMRTCMLCWSYTNICQSSGC
eukprot:1156591-Pelagomonas_calceolata.AAC.2